MQYKTLIISNCFFKMQRICEITNISCNGFTCFLEPDCISEELLHFYPAFAEQMPTEPWKEMIPKIRHTEKRPC